MNIKISFIIAAYNAKECLKKCLDSLVNQTLQEIEIKIVDDCSTENLFEIVTEFLQDPRVSYTRLEKNKAAGGARNFGYSLATGEYIGFIDSDDWIDLNYAETLYESAKKHDADIAMCGLIRNFDTPRKEVIYKCKYDTLYKFTGEMAFRIMTNEYDVGCKIIPSALNRIYKKEYLDYNNLSFIENILFEDQCYSYKALLNGASVICVPNTLYHHYKRNGSIVQSFTQKHLDDMDIAYKQMKQFLKTTHKYEQYKNNYYNSLTHFYNLIIREIFEFVYDEDEKKKWMKQSFSFLKNNIDLDEYIEYCTAERLRKHLQPFVEDTTIN